ncbi:MAG TPA: hypothetical protein DEA45_02155 [Acholeplasmataceae bacterium]|nr:hypothetical protein [Acholeplasmataceae bacterium]
MQYMFILLTLLAIGILSLSVYIIYLTKKNNLTEILRFFSKFLIFVFCFFVLIYVVLSVVALFTKPLNEISLILLLDISFRGYFFYYIFKDSLFLMNQLNHGIVFEEKNAEAVLRMGKNFILITAIQILTGLGISVVRYIGGTYSKEFIVTIASEPLIFIVVGFILYILALIYLKAIEIYEENKLTV